MVPTRPEQRRRSPARTSQDGEGLAGGEGHDEQAQHQRGEGAELEGQQGHHGNGGTGADTHPGTPAPVLPLPAGPSGGDRRRRAAAGDVRRVIAARPGWTVLARSTAGPSDTWLRSRHDLGVGLRRRRAARSGAPDRPSGRPRRVRRGRACGARRRGRRPPTRPEARRPAAREAFRRRRRGAWPSGGPGAARSDGPGRPGGCPTGGRFRHPRRRPGRRRRHLWLTRRSGPTARRTGRLRPRSPPRTRPSSPRRWTRARHGRSRCSRRIAPRVHHGGRRPGRAP